MDGNAHELSRLQFRLAAPSSPTSQQSWPVQPPTATSGSASACSATSGLTTYTYNTANEITGMNGNTTGWSYDKNGNELSAAGQLPRTGETYNDFNQLTAITTGGTTSHYTYAGTDSSNRLTADATRIDQGPAGISSTTTDGQNTGFVRDPAGTLIGMTSGANPYYYVTNNQGAPSVLVDNTGVEQNRWDYGPTGNARPETTTPVAEPFGYAGAYLDITGLYKMGARYYDQTTGRFTQPDPSGKEQNLYLYAAGDPINRVDPTGLFSWSGALDIGSNIFGVVSGCIGGIGAAATSGAIEAASVFGPVGTGVAVGTSCLVGGVAGYYGADIITYQ
ncbi:RHS repeat-associated core domain-containing protein [Streptomyces sp. NPDC088725]|uniref:RHS repeat-associated core domain-containing protein n=1 Tax=Streptomyces sp. NPDC088725 TaxID=3365873 RepID=UPI00382A686E